MRACLRLISLLLLFFPQPSLASKIAQTEIADSVVTDSVEIRQFNLLLQVRGEELSGIFVMQLMPQEKVIGTLINEFGMTAFDFEYNDGDTDLSNLPAFLDHWFIRRILEGDLSFFFSHLRMQQNVEKRSRLLTFLSNGDIILWNKKFKIKYTFTPIIEEE